MQFDPHTVILPQKEVVMQQEALLGVEDSAQGRRWQLVAANETSIEAIKHQFGLSQAAAYVLSARGHTAETLASFLQPSLRQLMPDPLSFKAMDAAVDRLVRAIKAKEKIAVIGDYDVDGQSSIALLVLYLRHVGIELRFVSPDRLSQGYGPNVMLIRQLHDEGASLCLTVDCGTTSFDPLNEAQKLGMDMIVLDHHVQEDHLPPAVAIVNPNRIDEVDNPCKTLCAAGVVFMALIALNRALDYPVSNPQMMALLDIVGLATVADVVPLLGLNRAFVTTGLKIIDQQSNLGLTTLRQVASLPLDQPASAYDFGFRIGPRINAGGRIGKCDLGALLMTARTADEALSLAQELDRLNTERQTIQMHIMDMALPLARAQAEQGAKSLVVAHESWHPGVVGIVAGKLKEEFDLPTFVIGCHAGKWSGSGRSIFGVDLGHHVIAAKEAGLLTKGGGHKMAAGLSLDIARLADFQTFLDQCVAADLQKQGGKEPYRCDCVVSVGGLTLALADEFEKLAPYGQGHERPRIAVPSVQVSFVKAIGKMQDTLSCTLVDSGRNRIAALAFGAMNQALGQMVEQAYRQQRPLHVIGDLKAEVYQGQRQAKLFLKDAAWA